MKSILHKKKAVHHCRALYRMNKHSLTEFTFSGCKCKDKLSKKNFAFGFKSIP